MLLALHVMYSVCPRRMEIVPNSLSCCWLLRVLRSHPHLNQIYLVSFRLLSSCGILSAVAGGVCRNVAVLYRFEPDWKKGTTTRPFYPRKMWVSSPLFWSIPLSCTQEKVHSITLCAFVLALTVVISGGEGRGGEVVGRKASKGLMMMLLFFPPPSPVHYTVSGCAHWTCANPPDDHKYPRSNSNCTPS